MHTSRGEVFQAEATASAKTLRLDCGAGRRLHGLNRVSEGERGRT